MLESSQPLVMKVGFDFAVDFVVDFVAFVVAIVVAVAFVAAIVVVVVGLILKQKRLKEYCLLFLMIEQESDCEYHF